MEIALSIGKELLLEHFVEIRWSEKEICETRRVWIECLGIPHHKWTIDNIRKIGEEWGSVVCLDSKTKMGESLCSTKILIDTCVQFI